MSLESIIGAIMAGILGIFFWMFKRGHTRIDKLDERLRKSVTEQEVRVLIEDKLAPIRLQNMDLARRLGRVEGKIDHLIELMMKKHK